MKQILKSSFRAEMKKARSCYTENDLDRAFTHFERAHIIGQRYFIPHLVSHWWMFKIGFRRADFREVFGQIMRMIAVIPGFIFGWVPKGNTGGANVSPFKPMPLPDDLAPLLEDYIVAKDVWLRVLIFTILLILVATGQQ